MSRSTGIFDIRSFGDMCIQVGEDDCYHIDPSAPSTPAVPIEPIPADTGGTINAPYFTKTEKIENTGTPVGQFLERHPVENIFKLRVQMGNEYGAERGWHTVMLPQKMINAHVVASSGPRSAEVPLVTLRIDRRSQYILAFSTTAAELIVDPIKELIPPIPIINDIIDDICDEILKPIVSEVSKLYGSLCYDLIVKPSTDLTEQLIRSTIPFDLPDAWGMERGRSVHTIDIRRITEESFQWYSYGEQYINWIAMGMSPDGESAVPPELTQPIEDVKSRLDDLEARLQDFINQIVGERPTAERRRLLQHRRFLG